jgi:hypothetical protein
VAHGLIQDIKGQFHLIFVSSNSHIKKSYDGYTARRLVIASPVMTKSRAEAGGSNYPENGLVKPLRRDTRALSRDVTHEPSRAAIVLRREFAPPQAQAS